MSTILDQGGAIVPDRYPELADASAPLTTSPALLTLERFLAEGAPPGQAVLLPNTIDVQTLPPALLSAPLLVLSYPAFADGRAYSQARLLSRSSNPPELRARGEAVIYDQLQMLKRCGFTQFELRDGQDTDACSRLLAGAPPF